MYGTEERIWTREEYHERYVKLEAEIKKLKVLLAMGWYLHEDEWDCRDAMSNDYREWMTEVRRIAIKEI